MTGAQVSILLSPHDARARPTIGCFVAVRTGRSLALGVVCEVASAAESAGIGIVDLLGEVTTDPAGGFAFRRGVCVYPQLGDEAFSLTADLLGRVFTLRGNAVEIGRLHQDIGLPALIDADETVRKHFAVFGSTGAGKSSAVAVLLTAILKARPDLRALIVDPHSEYGSCFGQAAHIVSPADLTLPFWLFEFDEFSKVLFGERTDVDDEKALLAECIPLAKESFAVASAKGLRFGASSSSGYTIDSTVPYRMQDLVAMLEARMGKLENRSQSLAYQRLLTRINRIRQNPRYGFMFDCEEVSLTDVLCRMFRLDDQIARLTILQLSGFPSEAVDAAVSVLFRLAFEFGLWSDGAVPLLVVCEEAHRYANADPVFGFRPAREGVSRIAKEGRKHAVFLGLVTQRPAELDPTLVSQCGTVFAMRMGNDRDQAIVRAAVSDEGGRLLRFLSSMRIQEALAFGEGVPIPMRLQFEELAAERVPRSRELWQSPAKSVVNKRFVDSVVSRWRGVEPHKKPEAPVESLFMPGGWASN